MSVLNISFAIIKDQSAFDDYVTQAAKVMQAFDVEVVARGVYLETEHGDDMPTHVGAIFRYPNLDEAHAFFQSSAYRALVPLRDRACDMTIRFYEEPSAPSAAGGDKRGNGE